MTCWDVILGLAQPEGTVQSVPKVLALARVKVSIAGKAGSLGLGDIEGDLLDEGETLGLADGETDTLGETLKLTDGDIEGLAEGEMLTDTLGLMDGE